MAERHNLKAENIEGLRELISEVIREQGAVFVPTMPAQDVEELRRSPAGAVIRLEEKVDQLAERFTELRATVGQVAARMVTKEELAAEIKILATREGLQAGLARMATKEDLQHLATREELQAGLARMATKEDLQPLATKEELQHLATKEELQAGLARMATKEDLQHLATREELQAGLARMATKEDLRAGLDCMVTKEDLDTRLDGLEKQINTLRIAFFAVVTLIVGLQTAILIKLLFP